jgi:hypothetical protein
MKLYHFTCVEHLASIQRDDLIITTESNVSFEREHAGPDVVWLSSDPGRPPRDSWTHGSYYDKTRIRITVDVPDAVKWARTRDVERDARRGLILAGGGTHDDWYVVERAITVDEFIEIADLDTSDVMTLTEGRGMNAQPYRIGDEKRMMQDLVKPQNVQNRD